jgi:transcriptional regulator with XRE-family HTH domain
MPNPLPLPRPRPDTVSLIGLDPAALIREVREIAGLSQRELATKIGTKQSVVSRWERGLDVPRIDTLARILRACGFDGELRFRRHDDVDRGQIVQSMRPSPAERAQNFQVFVETARELQRARKVMA